MTDLRSARPPAPGPGDHVRGGPHPPLVVVYSDFSCAACALTHARLQRSGVGYAFRHFVLRSRHPRALALACAAEAAGRQGAFWEMHDALFDDPGHTDDPHLWARARALELDLERFERDRREEELARRVRRDVESGLRAGVTVTPTLFVGDRCLPGPPAPEWLASLVGAIRIACERSDYREDEI